MPSLKEPKAIKKKEAQVDEQWRWGVKYLLELSSDVMKYVIIED